MRCGVVPDTGRKLTISPNIIAARTDAKKINSYYAAIFFNTKYGFLQIERGLKVVAQPTIQSDLVRNLQIVLLSNQFQLQIEKLFKHYLKLENLSRTSYEEANKRLLSELGLTNWQPKHRLSFVRNSSEVEKAERIDAEYFQPKYDEIVDAIKNYPGGWSMLDDLANVKGKRFTPKDKLQYKYIELRDIGKNGEIVDCTTENREDLPTRARRRVKAGDVIVYSIEGSLSSIALVEKEYHHALCSTGFHVINSDVLNSETLLVLMKSIVGQMQLEKGCNGTILTAINKGEFNRIVLPIVSEEIQTRIQQKISESFNLRKQSKHLLESAKHAVEVAIEEDEKTALEWLEKQLPGEL